VRATGTAPGTATGTATSRGSTFVETWNIRRTTEAAKGNFEESCAFIGKGRQGGAGGEVWGFGIRV